MIIISVKITWNGCEKYAAYFHHIIESKYKKYTYFYYKFHKIYHSSFASYTALHKPRVIKVESPVTYFVSYRLGNKTVLGIFHHL